MLKGLVLGGGVGAGLQVGLGWGDAGGLLGFLIAMGTGATAGIICGKPPWRAGVWIEVLLKGVAGLAVGALLYWLTWSYAGFGVPFDLPGAVAGTPWTSQPLLYAPLVALLFGSLVELDNTGGEQGDGEGGSRKNQRVSGSAKTRVADDPLDLSLPEPAEEAPRRRKARK